MDERAYALLQLTAWAERGWIVTLQARGGLWVVAIETPGSFEANAGDPRSHTEGLRFNTATHETVEAAISAAAQVLR